MSQCPRFSSRQGGWSRATVLSIVALATLATLTVWAFMVFLEEEQRPEWALGKWMMDAEKAQQIHEESWQTIDEDNRKALEFIETVKDPAQRRALIHEQKRVMAVAEPRRLDSPDLYIQLDADGFARYWKGVNRGVEMSGPWTGDDHSITITWTRLPASMMVPSGVRMTLTRQGEQLVDEEGTIYHRPPK